ncbi:MAG: hypothetical protein H0U90_08610 [Actinobacteria bacterium]|nr:hypothetical protein [Actinomycetota bacterium]
MIVMALATLLAVAVGAVRLSDAAAETVSLKRYNVVFEGTATTSGFAVDGGRDAALALVTSAGGTVVSDLTRQIGVVTALSTNSDFASTVGAAASVDVVGEDFVWKAMPTMDEALMSGELSVVGAEDVPGGGPQPSSDLLEPGQWSMKQIQTEEAHAIQAGSPLVQVGILDSGIDATHSDLSANVDCSLGRDFVPVGPSPLSIGTPCNDNQFHGTHVTLGLLLRELIGRGHHVRGRQEVRGHQHELVHRRRPAPLVDRAQVHERPGAARVPSGKRACDPVRAKPGRRAGRRARKFRLRPGPPARAVRERVRGRPGRDAGRDRHEWLSA